MYTRLIIKLVSLYLHFESKKVRKKTSDKNLFDKHKQNSLWNKWWASGSKIIGYLCFLKENDLG